MLVPGGSEHIGLFLSEATCFPRQYKNHMNTFHSQIIGRLAAQPRRTGRGGEGDRQAAAAHQGRRGDALLPLRGTSRYGVEGGPLRNPESDKTYYAAIKASLPKTIEVVERDLGPEDPEFVKECCDRLIGLIEAKKARK